MSRDRAETGAAWLGRIPSDWDLAPAKALFGDRREPNTPDDVHLTPSQALGVLPQADYMAITGGSVVQNLSGQDSMKHVEPDDFVIHLRSFQGGIERSTFRGKVSAAYTVLSPREGVVADYFRWLLKSSAYIQELRTTTNQLRDGQSIRFGDFVKVPLPVPPAPEQRAIADYLDRETARIDTLIEEQQRLVEMLRGRKRSVVRASVPDPRSGAAGADKLGRRTRIGNGSTPRRENLAYWEGGSTPWLNSAVVNQHRVGTSDQFVTDTAIAECHLPLVPAGSVLVALTGQGRTRGTATVLDIDATINQHMAYVTPERDFWDSDYLLWALTAAYDELRAVSDENGSTKGALTCEQLKRFRLVHPPLDEQRRIAEHLDEQTAKINALIAESERFIELSRERRAALITAAVTGQIDVRNEVA